MGIVARHSGSGRPAARGASVNSASRRTSEEAVKKTSNKAAGKAFALVVGDRTAGRSDAGVDAHIDGRGEAGADTRGAAGADASAVACGLRPQAESLEQCVQRSLERYFADLGGAQPHALHEMVMAAVERPLLRFAVERCAGNQSAAADLLGINRNTLRRRLIDHGLI